MNITYDGLSQANAQNLVTFTDIPNILKVTDSNGGSYANITLSFTGDITQTNVSTAVYITLMGETISGVRNYGDAINRNFFMSSSPIATAASVAKALRNCPTLMANFIVKHNSNQVILTARKTGVILARTGNYYSTSISDTYLTASANDGTASSQLEGALIDVDVYKNGEYVTTLEKNFYNGECAFNMSPVLGTIAVVGETKPYTLSISSTDAVGNYTSLATIPTNYIAQGYMVNQGNKFIALDNNIVVAQNYARGTGTLTTNDTTLYVYASLIPICFYRLGSQSVTITTTYRDSAYNAITSQTQTYSDSSTTNKLCMTSIYLNTTTLRNSFYVDVEIGNDTIRYNVIKPVKATEYYQRIMWRNSYGGISFFDFTGQKSETRDVEITTYQKNIFDYYEDRMIELDKIYDNKIKYTVTLKSHLMENDAKFLFNELLQSPMVWTWVNNKDYAIIIDSVNVDEIDNNNIYQATVKYHYSQHPNIL